MPHRRRGTVAAAGRVRQRSGKLVVVGGCGDGEAGPRGGGSQASRLIWIALPTCQLCSTAHARHDPVRILQGNLLFDTPDLARAARRTMGGARFAVTSGLASFRVASDDDEVLREVEATLLTRSASCIWLARDARKHRLLIRFRAVGFQDGAVVTRHGVLGQAKQFGSNAIDILEATKAITHRATTPGAGIAVR